MEDNRNSDRSEEELRRIIREKISHSRANGAENLYVKTQAMILQASSALSFFVNVDSGILSPLASSTSPSTNLTVLLGLSESPDPSNLASYPLSLNKIRRRQPVHPNRIKSANKKSIMKREPKTYQVVLLEEDENKSKSYRYSDEMILGTWFIDEKEEDINMKLMCYRRNISAPTVCKDFKWDFGHIKMGKGNFMCGLLYQPML